MQKNNVIYICICKLSGAAARTGSLIKKDKETVQKLTRRRFLLIKKHNENEKAEQINRIANKRYKINKRRILKEVLNIEEYIHIDRRY